ncbi:MAG TPA: VOC family protein [Bacteroidales bacterium]|nr:VOC family protein [Bacteroidales bacterium]
MSKTGMSAGLKRDGGKPVPVYPCLWFDGKAKEAAEFYCSVLENTVITSENNIVVTFESSGQKFMCLNGGPEFKINPSISFYIICKSEEEIDRLWKRFIDGGSALMPLGKYEWSRKYGWLSDRYGVNWQLSYGGIEDVSQKISPVLMFTGDQFGRAEEALHFYISVFKNSKVKGIARYLKGEQDVEGKVKHAQFILDNKIFMSMDSSYSHQFSFNEAVSLVVECETQEEIDYYWDRLTEGGEEVQCGWLKDRFGVSWQVVPAILGQLMSDPSRAERVTTAFLKMKKLDIEELINA